MTWIRVLLCRAAGLFAARRRDRELDLEIDSHLQMLVDDNVRAGMGPDEARRTARARFDGIESVKEAYRDRRGVPFLETTIRDARYALRALRRYRGASVIGILVMALAIGANTAVFSVVHGVLLSPLPFDQANRIVALTYSAAGSSATGERSRQISVPDFLDWQSAQTSFDAMAYYASAPTAVGARTVAEYTLVTSITEDYLRVFAVQPALGRPFTVEEAKEGGTGAAVLSDRFARQAFGDPAAAVGATIRLFNRAVPVVGVMSPAFDFPTATDIWFTAIGSRASLHRRGNNFRAIARVSPGVSLEQAQADMTAISERLASQYPETNKNIRVRVTALQRELVGDIAPMLYLLLGAVALVLLIACATMATLLLAQATARRPELALRAALGAHRSRIVRQLLVEAAVQATAAGALGVAFAFWGTRALVSLAPPDVPRLDQVHVSSEVLLFTCALCAVVTLLFGLPPALQAARVDVSEPLRHGTGRTAGRPSGRAREALVVLEIALALVLAVTGTLLVRSVIALQRAPLGFEPDRILLMQATARPRADDWSDSRAFFEALGEDLARLPGVTAVGTMMAPPGHVESESGYWIDRVPAQSPLSAARPAVMNVIGPGTFATLGVPIRRGRDFAIGDRTGAQMVAIVNDALAREAFGHQDPIGRSIIAGFDSPDPMTIVGVVGNIRQAGPGRGPQPELYMPYMQHRYNGATLALIIRTTGDPAALTSTVERTARARSPDVSVRVRTLNALLAAHVTASRFRAWVLGMFAGLALGLAMAGVYGVMAFVAGQRSKEIAIRLALGASAASVSWLMLARGLKLTALGIAIGLGGALATGQFVRGMLFEVQSHDLITYSGVAAALGVLSLVATYLPARRATHVDPLIGLRQE